MKRIALLAASAALLAAPLAQADFIATTYDVDGTLPAGTTGPNFSTIFDPLSGNATQVGFNNSNATSAAGAQKITIAGVGTWDLTQLTLPLAKGKSSFTGDKINVSIIPDGGAGAPTGVPIWTGNFATLSAGTLSTAVSSVSVAITGASVTGGSAYWVVLTQNQNLSGSGFNGLYWHKANSADNDDLNDNPWVQGAYTTAIRTLGDGSGNIPTGAWSVTTGSIPSPNVPYALALEGTTPVPEPGQIAMAGVLLLGIAGFGARHYRNSKRA